MRFTYAESMTDPDFYVPLAQAAERVGFDSMTIADSICYPEESDSVYPYTPDGSREFLENKPFIEAMILAMALGAATSTLRFTTFVLKLPVRPPVLVAKQAASVAYLTGNRLRLGVGVSPWPDDFQIMDVPWERRGRRTDEAIDIVRGLTGGGYFEYHGEIFDVPSIKINPVPTQPIPILIGGHSDAALRRAVVRGDGWTHAGGDPEELDRMLDRLQKIRAAEGKSDTPFEIHVASAEAYTVDGIKRLEDKGVTDVIVGFRNSYDAAPDTEPLEQKIANLENYAESVIAKVL
ncbi:TIGR03619 family F420-dependent LLM class oxidoreductase [Rhodococcus hoagii]|nr:TIGR03619 family F420-dependent LLM class oxidoreductase [Prescottella equi]NKS09202.1 TIGR03619 family F420-dependent LLM class oxidoreductase [Prescottella equi]NKS91813.1 TIGR03619 family F420-dependent LLM class oxidoreductase [Prescottella equi]NKT09163.1 TIGR03619 family F420-dependent LLM class oxidoreductase [Prescottella equi]NKT19376.1 TIGR03619 family F420-dependent LLM class oxidoreductase [Prescottella equi]